MNKEELRKQLEELGNSNPQESLRLSGCLIKIIKQEIEKGYQITNDTGLVTVLKIRDRRKKIFRKTYDTGLVTFMM